MKICRICYNKLCLTDICESCSEGEQSWNDKEDEQRED